MVGQLTAIELRDLALAGSAAALAELNRRLVAGDDAAKMAGGEVAIAKRRGSRGARRAINICNGRAVRKLNRAWEAGAMPGIKRDTGHGAETLDEWRRRRRPHRRPTGHAPRRRTNARTAGSRRTSARSSGGGSSGDPDDGDPNPPGLDLPPARREAAGRRRP